MDSLAYLFSLEQFGIKFGLENIRSILRQLGDPHRAFRTVHIAGTNGKGSVTAMVESALRAAGHRTARYTSPHLVDLSERFVIGGAPVDPSSLLAAADDVRAAIETLRGRGSLEVMPTFFEATTAVAFELFRRASVEMAVVEVGLGGRLDATNVVVPEAAAITSIALDHQLYLGSTLRSIAIEKAGIIKPGVPVVVGPLDAEAATAIDEVARERRAPIHRAKPDDVVNRTIGLAGLHQRTNAAVAVTLIEVLASRGIDVPAAAVEAGLADPRWPGRIDRRTLPDGREVVLDAAHNPAGAEALANYLRSEAPPMPLVFAAMRDKDAGGMLRPLLKQVSGVTFTRASNQRAADPHQLAAIAREVAPSVASVIEPSLPRALEHAWTRSPRILVAGSIFLLGDVLQHLGLPAYRT